ncbi:hypothetical protein MBANPS3_001699 [Mucor bainieri]
MKIEAARSIYQYIGGKGCDNMTIKFSWSLVLPDGFSIRYHTVLLDEALQTIKSDIHKRIVE